MTKTLIKKQLLEVFSWIYQEKKTGKQRSKGKIVLFTFLYILLFGIIAVIFTGLAITLCPTLASVNMTWLYMALMVIMSLTLAVIGSVFNTYTTLYKAKDNDLLLSMPITTRTILVSRLAGVFTMGLMYELIIMLPAVVVFFIFGKFTVAGAIFSVILIFLVAVLSLALSCILGWVVAVVSNRLKNQKIVTVLISLVFFGIYYYFCGNAGRMVQNILNDPTAIADKVRGSLYPFYLAGRGAEGSVVAMLGFAAMAIVLMGIIYFAINRNFVKLATSNRGEKKIAYIEKTAQSASPDRALLKKELRRFVGSATYMLNCGFGIAFMVVGAVAMVIEGGTVHDTVMQFSRLLGDITFIACPLLICLLVSMCDISAPSISLEGKSLWLTQVLPVTGYQVLKSKRNAHLILTLVPTVILLICAEFVLRMPPLHAVLMPIVVILYVYMMACLGVVLNLKFPNLNWTNETVPIKQSASVTICLFGGWAVVIVLGIGSYFLDGIFGMTAAYAVICAVLLAANILMTVWMKNKGSRIFEML